MKKPTEPYIRKIGEKEIMAYEVGKPGTSTGNELVDTVLRAFVSVEKAEGKEVAEYLQLPERKLSAAMEILTGLSLGKIAELVRVKDLHEALLLHTDVTTDDIAEFARLSDRSVLHRLMKNKKYAHYFADIDMKALRPDRYYKYSWKGKRHNRTY